MSPTYAGVWREALGLVALWCISAERSLGSTFLLVCSRSFPRCSYAILHSMYVVLYMGQKTKKIGWGTVEITSLG